MENVVIYARYSSSAQTEQSIEGQLRVCKDYAERKGYNIIGEYIDRAMTGTNDNRPEFQKMIADSSKKEFDFVLVYKFDRFSRSKYDNAIYKHKLQQNGVRVISAMEEISNTPEGVLMEGLLEMFAEMYSKDLSQKVKRGIKENILKGNAFGGTPPIGYKRVNKKNVIDEEKVPLIKYLFKEYEEGKSLINITNELNAMHYTNTKGKPLQAKNLIKCLKNRCYTGIYQYENIISTDIYPQIISVEQFENVQDRIRKNMQSPASKKAKTEYLLSGKAFCGYCGNSMYGVCGTSRTGDKHNYYYCKTRHKQHNCKKQNELQSKLENEVFNAVFEKLLTKEAINEIVNGVLRSYSNDNISIQMKELNLRLLKIDNEQEKCFRMALNYDTPDLIKRANEYARDLQNQKKDLENELKKLKIAQGIKYTRKELIKYFNLFLENRTNSPEFKKRILTLFLNKVYVFDNHFVIYCNIGEDNENISFEKLKNDLSENKIKLYPKGSNIGNPSQPKKCLAKPSIFLFKLCVKNLFL